MQIKSETMQFYEQLEEIIRLKKFENDFNLTSLQNIIYQELDDLVAPFSEIDLGRLIGKGASSEVYFSSFKYCPCAVKKINLGLMNSKQIVIFFNIEIYSK